MFRLLLLTPVRPHILAGRSAISLQRRLVLAIRAVSLQSAGQCIRLAASLTQIRLANLALLARPFRCPIPRPQPQYALMPANRAALRFGITVKCNPAIDAYTRPERHCAFQALCALVAERLIRSGVWDGDPTLPAFEICFYVRHRKHSILRVWIAAAIIISNFEQCHGLADVLSVVLIPPVGRDPSNQAFACGRVASPAAALLGLFDFQRTATFCRRHPLISLLCHGFAHFQLFHFLPSLF
nr:MAG TPA: hypothetical protein [Caudoviricetes sp.]